MSGSLLEIRGLRLAMKTFDGDQEVLRGVDITVERGQILGIVGETGSGKSLTGLSVSRLVPTPPGRYLAGEIRFDGHDMLAMDEARVRPFRGRRIGMIFQDPTTNLNPSFRIGEQIVDVALHAGRVDPAVLGLVRGASRRAMRRAAWAQAQALLERVGIDDAARRMEDYPHQFSGDMRQRVLIAMALIGAPELLIADEPTTALDVSVQAQILRLIHQLVRERNLTVMFITHNLGVVAQLCTHVGVMYAGRIAEYGPVRQIFKQPREAYTRALLAAVPTAATPRGALRSFASPQASA